MNVYILYKIHKLTCNAVSDGVDLLVSSSICLIFILDSMVAGMWIAGGDPTRSKGYTARRVTTSLRSVPVFLINFAFFYLWNIKAGVTCGSRLTWDPIRPELQNGMARMHFYSSGPFQARMGLFIRPGRRGTVNDVNN